MNVFEWQATQIEQMGDLLSHAIANTDPGKLNWQPSTGPESKTRSVIDQATECVGLNRRFAALLRGESAAQIEACTLTSGDEAVTAIRSSAKELAQVVRGLNEADLNRTYPTGLGDMPGAFLIRAAATNMAYHFGQISFIQTLYGDTNRYFPDRK